MQELRNVPEEIVCVDQDQTEQSDVEQSITPDSLSLRERLCNLPSLTTLATTFLVTIPTLPFGGEHGGWS
ncbi:MAG: hypothetical protein GFH27_549311n140 [Chloroflexi bacterium AL-W]|nr:hypothetical protein [Chloroflexi bacterium AL-N1]NOK68682.1 hypothetical protein [Chloroflexi bacterium AL-N10]NOK76168.1 hypothetical protein [Chloroflexi bacterium AL-N5]NOK84195.1 hypothetical protein [Chloroflexi bacterium AL-W]NOK91306.1 hypothetical protein [Chloroflexi bacterium AL-N15]